MFDPVSWALSFGASKLAGTLIDHLFAPKLRNALDEVGQKWAQSLPDGIHTPPEALLQTEENGPARERLQGTLLIRSMVPPAEVWRDALLEAWRSRKLELAAADDEGNGFFQLEEKEAHPHIDGLARALELRCMQEPRLFQVSALDQLSSLINQNDDLRREVAETRSLLLDAIQRLHSIALDARSKTTNALSQLLASPHVCRIDGLVELNALLLVDEDSAVVAGEVRRTQSWVGPPQCTLEDAWFVPPSPDKLPTRLAGFERDWANRAPQFESRDPAEVVAAIAQFHHELVSLHPFEDGNGRVARAMTDRQARALLYKPGRLALHRQPDYQTALETADNGNIDRLIDLITRRLGLR